MGLVLSLALALMAFEYRVPFDFAVDDPTWERDDWDREVDVIPITVRKEKAPELVEPENNPETKARIDQKMKIVKRTKKMSKKSNRPSDLPEINPNFGDEDWEIDPAEGDVDLGDKSKIWDAPIPGFMPVFCACEHIIDVNERELCNEKKLYGHLHSKIRYPSEEKEKGVQGIVSAQYVISTSGKIVGVEILKSPSKGLSEEAERVLRMMPCIVPARQHNHNVAVKYNIPIRFILKN